MIKIRKATPFSPHCVVVQSERLGVAIGWATEPARFRDEFGKLRLIESFQCWSRRGNPYTTYVIGRLRLGVMLPTKKKGETV